MNTKQLKQLIKDSVREVIKEELSDILKEAILNNSKTKELINEDTSFKFNSNDVVQKPSMNSLRSTMNKFYSLPEGDKNPPKQNNIKIEEEVGTTVKNPYMKFFAQTAKEMTPQDIISLRNPSST